MDWGFYCRTCGVSSQTWFPNPKRALQAYRAVLPKIDALARDEDVTLPTVQIPVIVFLSSHTGHDLWIECDTGVLRMSSGKRPANDVLLPRFAGPSDRCCSARADAYYRRAARRAVLPPSRIADAS